MRRRIKLFAALVAALLVAASCGGDSGTESGGGVTQGGTLRVGAPQIDSINPFVAFNQYAYVTFWYIYPFLVQYDDNLGFAPDFAKSWDTSKDGLTWTFHTVDGGKWSDGKPLTAEDAAWTINTILKYKGGATSNSSGYVAHIKNAEAPDPNTLVVHYDEPVGNVLSQWQQFAILPKHVWSQHTGNDGKDLKSFKPESELPVVSGGPFTLTEYRKNEIALFEKNPNFYGPEPIIDALGFQYFTNTDAQLTALKNGEIDVVTDVPATAVDSLEGSPNIEVVTAEGVEVNDFIINSNPKKPEHRELLDFDVKEAMAHAIDKQKIVDVVFNGTGEPAATFIPPATGKWHNPNLKPEEFDLDLANQILDDEGLKRGPDGIRVAGDHKMEYEVITPSSLDWVNRTFSIIQSDFDKIGITLTQKSLDDTAAFAAVGAPGYKYLDFDLALWGWVPLIDPDFMLSTFTCEQYGGWSDSGYCDPKYDRMYQQQGVTLDQGKRKQIVWAMEQKIYDDKPYVMLNTEAVIEARNTAWEGFVISPQGSFNALSKATALEVHQTG